MRTKTGVGALALAVTMSGAGCAASLGYNPEIGPPGFSAECAGYREACVEVCRPFAVRHFGCHIMPEEGLVIDCDCMGKEQNIGLKQSHSTLTCTGTAVSLVPGLGPLVAPPVASPPQ